MEATWRLKQIQPWFAPTVSWFYYKGSSKAWGLCVCVCVSVLEETRAASPRCVPDTTVTSACGQMPPPAPASESSCCCSPILLSHKAMQNAWAFHRVYGGMRVYLQTHTAPSTCTQPKTYMEEACEVLNNVHGHTHTHGHRGNTLSKNTQTGLLPVQVSVCELQICTCRVGELGRVQRYSKAQQDFPIKSSRKTKRLITSYHVLHCTGPRSFLCIYSQINLNRVNIIITF